MTTAVDRRIPSILPDTIPAELKNCPQWVAWRWQERNGKRTKPPVNPHTGALASSTDPETWGTFADALSFRRANDAVSGIGFVFSKEDPYAGIDLDGCRDPETGELAPWALTIVQYVSSYTEVSPSGTGVKVFLQGSIPAGVHRGCFEMYDCGRYFTVTGQHLAVSPLTVANRSAKIASLHRWLVSGGEEGASRSREPRPVRLDEEALVDRAKLASNGGQFEQLWNGDYARYSSQSEADLALCRHLAFWTGADPDRVDRLFRRSGLYRPKWDERHFGDGRTYGAVTVERAIQGIGSAYSAHQRPGGEVKGPPEDGAALAEIADADEPLETDLGNAVRMARLHGEDIRYCFTTGTFHVWSGSHWPPDQTGEVQRRAKDTARSIFREAQAAPNREKSRQLALHAVRSQAEPRMAAMVKLVRSEPGIPISPAQLDTDPWLFNVLNGTIDLRTGQLRPHHRDDLITKIARVRYDPSAECPQWGQFLDRVMDGNPRLTLFLQKAVGYSLTADISEQVIFFLHGTGANGKSTFLSVILDLLADYGKQAAPGLLTLKKGDSHPTELADLAGARFVASVEVDEGRRLAEALTKWLTGGDRMKARFMRQDFFEFLPTHKLWLAANHKPAITGTDQAIWRRLRLIPFQVAIPEPEQDRLLGNKLRRELPGILNWALEGCLLWQREGLSPPEEVLLATNNYREEQDTLAGFLEDCCETGDEKKATAKDLYAAYRKWSDDSGEPAISQKAFAARLADRGFSGGHRGTNGRRWWRGVRLVTHKGLDLDTSDG